MHDVEYIVFIAGFCTTIAFLPQIVKIVKTKSTKDVSLLMYVIYCIGVIMWILYGYLVNSHSIITVNIITFILGVTVIWMKIIYK